MLRAGAPAVAAVTLAAAGGLSTPFASAATKIFYAGSTAGLASASVFTVGGSIIAHGVPTVAHLVEDVGRSLAERSAVLAFLATTALDALVGIASGVVAVLLFTGGTKLLSKTAAGPRVR